jgi:sterol 14-demethylase
MESRYSDGRALREHEITGLLLAAMFAGHHTSSATTSWTMLELLRNPDQLARATREIDRVFGDGTPVGHESLRALAFIENCVKEALRLHPPLYVLIRVAKEPFVHKKWYIAPGTWVLVSPAVAQRIPELFRDPLRFDPDRFAPPREEDRRDFAYIPFGGGRHKCPGNAFAILQVKAILTLLLGQFEFELIGDPIEPNYSGLVAGPKEPCRLRFRRRTRPSVVLRAGQLARAATAATVPAHAEQGVCPVAHGSATVSRPQLQIVLDRERCQGHEACVGEVPEVFRLSPDGKVDLISDRPSPELDARVRIAVKQCPSGALQLRETRDQDRAS